jgi:hypothetical protein
VGGTSQSFVAADRPFCDLGSAAVLGGGLGGSEVSGMAETDSGDVVRGELPPRDVLTSHLWLQRSRSRREDASVRVSRCAAGVPDDRGNNTVIELEFESPISRRASAQAGDQMKS